jgi:hypothetical protein
MANNSATINGTEYGFVDLKVIIPGSSVPSDGVIGIKYKTKREKKNIKGRGGKPVARARGSKDHEGSITVLQSVVEALEAQLGPDEDLTDLAPFNITVSYAMDGGTVKTDRLEFVEFTEYEKGLKEGDTNMEIELPLIIGNIKRS